MGRRVVQLKSILDRGACCGRRRLVHGHHESVISPIETFVRLLPFWIATTYLQQYNMVLDTMVEMYRRRDNFLTTMATPPTTSRLVAVTLLLTQWIVSSYPMTLRSRLRGITCVGRSKLRVASSADEYTTVTLSSAAERTAFRIKAKSRLLKHLQENTGSTEDHKRIGILL